MTALAEQVAHVALGNLVAHLEVERTEPGAEPTARRLALLGVVVGQPLVAAVGCIVHGDLAGQVGLTDRGAVAAYVIGNTTNSGPNYTTPTGRNPLLGSRQRGVASGPVPQPSLVDTVGLTLTKGPLPPPGMPIRARCY